MYVAESKRLGHRGREEDHGDGQCVGGVGVSGGDWDTDLRIAKAAVGAIGANWK
jgi:hypothetical protein